MLRRERKESWKGAEEALDDRLGAISRAADVTRSGVR